MRRLATNRILHSLCDFWGESTGQLPAPACQEAVLRHALTGFHVLQLTCRVKRSWLHTIRCSTVQRS